MTGEPRVIPTLIAKAVRRRLLGLILEQAPLALSMIGAVATLLLLVGTSIVNPWWLPVSMTFAITTAASRIRKHSLDSYRVAQLLDQRLSLHDSISTAWFLLTRQDSDAPVKEQQIRRAEQLATSVHTEQAFPFIFHRNWAIPALLFSAALALFVARYTRSEILEFHSSFVPLNFASYLLSPQAKARELSSADKRHPQRSNKGKRTDDEQVPGDASQRGAPAGTAADAGTPQAGQTTSLSPEQTIQNLQQQIAASQRAESSSGALERMKDVVSGLMTQLRQSAKDASQKSQQGMRNAPNSPSAKESQAGGNKDGQTASQHAAQGKDGHEGSETQASGVQASAVEKTTSATAGNANQSGRDAGSDSAQSGAGHNDGRKDLSTADQLKAIGKLDEIIGKRSAALTGDMTVEKSSGQQQLKTDYSNRVGEHTDRSGEINRDEIPPEYRDYIRAYMQAVRKQAPKNQ